MDALLELLEPIPLSARLRLSQWPKALIQEITVNGKPHGNFDEEGVFVHMQNSDTEQLRIEVDWGEQ